MCFFFFFKQKTAYEMRISDWSSDVCSSDLQAAGRGDARMGRSRASAATRRDRTGTLRSRDGMLRLPRHRGRAASVPTAPHGAQEADCAPANGPVRSATRDDRAMRAARGRAENKSEEHRVGKEGVSTGRSWGLPD